RGAAALWRLHERISGYHVGLRACAGARRARSLRVTGCIRRAAAAPGLPRLWRTHRADDAGAGLLPADLRASEPCPDRRVLYAGRHGRLVPECCGPAQMTARDPSLPDPFDRLNGRIVADHRPWPRIEVQADIWTEAADRLSRRALTLLGLWGEPRTVHMGVVDANDLSRILVLSLTCPEGRYPSVGRVHPPAIRLERAVADLFALVPVGLPDTRPWLDHDKWGVPAPLAAQQNDARPAQEYGFLPVEGENIHQLPVGPVHAGIIEPGHFRISADGETVVRLEERLGYTHKGIESLLQGTDLERAARLACRCSGDSTVAYGLAFARAVEVALGWMPPIRAAWLRALMAELERLANHLGDVGAIC